MSASKLVVGMMPHRRKPTFSDRMRLLLYGSESNAKGEEIGFMNSQIKEFASYDRSLKEVAHGSQSPNKDQVNLGMQKIEELLYLILSRSSA